MSSISANQQPLFGATVEKFSMGRSTGISVRNWQQRFLVISPTSIAYYTDHSAFTKKAKPKFEAPIKNFSLCILNATIKDHIEAKMPLLFILRVWDGGVFDLLVKPKSPDDKAQFMAAIRSATAEVKGFQMVGDADILGGEDKEDDDEELGVPKATVPNKPKKGSPARRTKEAPAPLPVEADDEVDDLGLEDEEDPDDI